MMTRSDDIGVRLLPNIRPYEQQTEISIPSTLDSRASGFMDALRQRTSTQDDQQTQQWVKHQKPVKKVKALPPARPTWMQETKLPRPETKAASTPANEPEAKPSRHPWR